MTTPTEVLVTNADFNGESFDGSPFVQTDKQPLPENINWLAKAITIDDISIAMEDRDYAIWNVKTPADIVRAEPGGIIGYDADENLYVKKKP